MLSIYPGGIPGITGGIPGIIGGTPGITGGSPDTKRQRIQLLGTVARGGSTCMFKLGHFYSPEQLPGGIPGAPEPGGMPGWVIGGMQPAWG